MVGGCGWGEASIHMHYRSEQEEEEGVFGGGSGDQLFLMGLIFNFKEKGGDGGGVQAQAVLRRSCMAFCCVSLSVDMHCVHNPAEVWKI